MAAMKAVSGTNSFLPGPTTTPAQKTAPASTVTVEPVAPPAKPVQKAAVYSPDSSVAQPQQQRFQATQGGLHAGGTVQKLAPWWAFESGQTKPQSMDDVKAAVQDGTSTKGWMIGDTTLPANTASAEKLAPWDQRTFDHHVKDTHGRNTTMLVLDRFDQAWHAANPARYKSGDRLDGVFVRTMASVSRQMSALGVDPQQNPALTEKIAAAVLDVDVSRYASDNVGDGLSWPYWLVNHQVEVFLDKATNQGALCQRVEDATRFEDFTVFKGFDRNKIGKGEKLQLAAFEFYDRLLSQHGVQSMDRVPPATAKIMATALDEHLTYLLRDDSAVERDCAVFLQRLDANAQRLETEVFDRHVSIPASNGKGFELLVLNLDKLDEGVFLRWAVPPCHAQHRLRMTVTPNAQQPDRRSVIVSVRDTADIGGKSLKTALAALNAAEQNVAKEKNLPASEWFGREVVILPKPPGSLLDPQQVADVLKQCDFGLPK